MENATFVSLVTIAAVTSDSLPEIVAAFDKVTVALVLPVIVVKSDAWTVVFAASLNAIVIASVLAVVNAFASVIDKVVDAVTTPPVAAVIVFNWSLVGVPLTVTANTSLLDKLPIPAARVAPSAEVIVPVIIPALVTAFNAFTLSTAPVCPDVISNGVAVDPPNITFVSAVTNAAVKSASVPCIFVCGLLTVTLPPVLPPIVFNTLASSVVVVSDNVITTSSSFATTLVRAS